MPRRRLIFGTALAAAIVASGVFGGVALTSSGGPAVLLLHDHSASPARSKMTTVRAHGNSSVARMSSFDQYVVYDDGPAFGNLPLVAVDHQAAAPSHGEQVGTNDSMFIYGACQIGAATADSCSPPLTIQVWPACVRYQDLYPFSPDESLRIRGVPAAFYEQHTRLELYTGDVTIVLFGTDRDQLLAAAGDLRGVNNSVGHNEPLPAPAAGAQSGAVSCSN